MLLPTDIPCDFVCDSKKLAIPVPMPWCTHWRQGVLNIFAWPAENMVAVTHGVRDLTTSSVPEMGFVEELSSCKASRDGQAEFMGQTISTPHMTHELVPRNRRVSSLLPDKQLGV